MPYLLSRIAAFALLAAVATPALAQAPAAPASAPPAATTAAPPAAAPAGPPARIRGTIISFKDQTLMVRPKGGGAPVKIMLAANFRVSGAVKLSLKDIKNNSYLGIAARKGKDGKLHALEVLVFPEALRGVGEGQRGWDLGPDSSMTNAAVSGMAKVSGGNVVSLVYKGGTADIVIDPKTPIWTIKPADAKLLRHGAYIVVMGMRNADGSVQAGNVTAEMNGFRPAT